MSKINILDDATINKIAAGEVIERPSSIIKELVENSIDAGSTSVSIEIENGGKDLIRILDNGSGIGKDDINKAFMRHATSKIRKVEDLDILNSLGFRGEALASISAVSNLEMKTKTKDDSLGTRVVLTGGKISSKDPMALNIGTQITVSDLFFNTPARRKFLKSSQSESHAITDLVNKLLIGNPNIKFKYVNNSKTVYESIGDGNLKNAIRLVYGKDVSDNLIELDYQSKYFNITGYICNNNVYRSNRNMQQIYINGRYVKSSNIMNIINESYKAIIPINKFPVYFINLEVDPSKIDVNVHPNKLEVKFDNEEVFFNELSDYVRGTLMKNSLMGKYKSKSSTSENKNCFGNELYNSLPQYNSFTYSKHEQDENSKNIVVVNSEKEKDTDIIIEKDNKYINTTNKSSVYSDTSIDNNISACIKEPENLDNINLNNLDYKGENKIEIIPLNESNNKYELFPEMNNSSKVQGIAENNKEISFFDDNKAANPDFENLKYIGIAFDTYIIFYKGNEMIFMDQHAAHERIRFESYMKKFKSNSISIQMLIDPIIMELSHNDMDMVISNKDIFKNFGFIVEEFGHKNISIRGVPNTFGTPESQKFIYELIDNIKKIDNIYDTKYDEIAEIACKSSIKANDKISYIEAIELVNQLKACENPYTCPHGRPILVKMSQYEIEKMFKRIQ